MLKKGPGQNFFEFSHSLTKDLNKWWRALGVNSLEGVRDIILLEQFMQGVSPNVKMYLCEKRVTTVSEAASMAEDFALVTRTGGKEGSDRQWRANVQQKQPASGVLKGLLCYACNGQGHIAADCPLRAPSKLSNGVGKMRLSCYKCGQAGHYSYDCKQKYPRRTTDNWRGGATAMCVGLKSEDSVVIEEEGRRWNPYTLTGYISTKNGSTKSPVKVLRDTGATHTLLRACAVPELRRQHTGQTSW